MLMRTVVVAALLVMAFLMGWLLETGGARSPNSGERAPQAPVKRPTDESGGAPTEAEAEAPSSSNEVEALVERFLKRIREASKWSDRSQRVRLIGREIAGLSPPEKGLAVLKRLYAEVNSVIARGALVRSFDDVVHTYVLGALALAMEDQNTRVSRWANAALLKFAFRSFEGDLEAYQEWNQRYENLPIADAWTRSAREFVEQLQRSSSDAIRRAAAELGVGILNLPGRAFREMGVAKALRDAGLVEVVEGILGMPEMSECERTNVLGWVLAAEPSDDQVRRLFLPLVERPDEHEYLAIYIAAKGLGRSDRKWAMEPLLRALERTRYPAKVGALADAIIRTQDRSAIPRLIAVLVDDNSERTRAPIGRVLEHWIHITYDPSHDAAWWRQWWEENRTGFGGGELPTKK